MTENLEYRINELEDDMKDVCGDVKVIMTNHLPHIQTELEAIKIQLKIWSWMMGLIISGVIALVIKTFLV